MKRINQKSLPTGFRYLFTTKEVKMFEQQLGVRFNSISFGHITNSDSLQPNHQAKSSLHPVSISANPVKTEWGFSIYQSGFRSQLLPDKFEHEVKEKVYFEIVSYINKIKRSRETDIHHFPQLWIYAEIVDYQVEVRKKEII